MINKKKLTKSAVEALTLPDSGQHFVWDADLTGFGVKLTPTGRLYVAQGRINGKSKRVTLGKHGTITTDQARKKAQKTIAGFLDGIDPVADRKATEAFNVTLDDVVEGYKSDRGKSLSPTTLADYEKHLSKSFHDWRKLPVQKITRDKVATRHKELSEKSKAQANLAFRYLKSWLNYARARYRPDDTPLLPENPVSVLDRRQRGLWNQTAKREVRIPDEKIGVAWNILRGMREAQTSATSADVVCFLLLTGCRWSEAAKLTWDRVNLDEQWFFLPDPKNRRPVKLPLSGVLVEILKLRQNKKGFVFPAKTKTGHKSEARTPLKKISAAAGVDICHHDLRRTYTNIAWKKCRIDLTLVRLLTNHKMSNDVTLDVYGDAGDLRFLLPEVDRVTAWIVEQGKIAAAGNVVQLAPRLRA